MLEQSLIPETFASSLWECLFPPLYSIARVAPPYAALQINPKSGRALHAKQGRPLPPRRSSGALSRHQAPGGFPKGGHHPASREPGRYRTGPQAPGATRGRPGGSAKRRCGRRARPAAGCAPRGPAVPGASCAPPAPRCGEAPGAGAPQPGLRPAACPKPLPPPPDPQSGTGLPRGLPPRSPACPPEKRKTQAGQIT